MWQICTLIINQLEPHQSSQLQANFHNQWIHVVFLRDHLCNFDPCSWAIKTSGLTAVFKLWSHTPAVIPTLSTMSVHSIKLHKVGTGCLISGIWLGKRTAGVCACMSYYNRKNIPKMLNLGFQTWRWTWTVALKWKFKSMHEAMLLFRGKVCVRVGRAEWLKGLKLNLWSESCAASDSDEFGPDGSVSYHHF